MTTEHRTPEEIEREIESQRSELTSNLEGLKDKFTIDTLVRQIGEQFREHGGDVGRSISDQVKANPIPLALTGIGLAWMMFGGGQRPGSSGFSGAEENARRPHLDQGRSYARPDPRLSNHDHRPSWARVDHQAEPSLADVGSGSHNDGGSRGEEGIGGSASSVASTVSETISDAGSSLSGAASSAGSTIADGAKAVKSGLAAARDRVAEGTEELTEEARQRVIAARQKAMEMGRNTSQSVTQGADAAVDFYDRQPLVIGALALAVGAALGGALPRTRAEDDLIGGQSDALYAEAERIFEEEKSKAMAVVKAVKDEVKDIATETKSDLDSSAPGDRSVAQVLGDKAKLAAERVTDVAKTTAQKEKLGKPRN